MEETYREDIDAVMRALVDAWARHDAQAYGALFTERASYVTFAGTLYQGRADIVASHRALFEKILKGTRLVHETVELRMLNERTAVLVGRGDTCKARAPRTLGKVQTYTLVREDDGAWRIASFHNTQRRRWLEALTFKLDPRTAPRALTSAVDNPQEPR